MKARPLNVANHPKSYIKDRSSKLKCRVVVLCYLFRKLLRVHIPLPPMLFAQLVVVFAGPHSVIARERVRGVEHRTDTWVSTAGGRSWLLAIGQRLFRFALFPSRGYFNPR